MGHASSEAISHLEASTEDVKIQQPKLQAPKTHECKPCALSKTQRIISQITTKIESSIQPFKHVTFDLIQHNQTYNEDQWTVHATCDLIGFNIIFTTRYKTAIFDIFTQILHLVEWKYNQKIIFIHMDRKKTLTKAYQNELTSQGITLEISTLYTPEQNGHTERQRRMLASKAHTMCIAANLPQNLWLEVVKAASYIANKTPTKRNQWKMLFEMVTR